MAIASGWSSGKKGDKSTKSTTNAKERRKKYNKNSLTKSDIKALLADW